MTSSFPSPAAPVRPPRRWVAAVTRGVSQTFFKGLIAILPLAATIAVLLWLASWAEAALGPALGWLLSYVDHQGLRHSYYRPPMGLIVSVAMVFLLGLLLHAWFVRELIIAIENLLQRIPVARTVVTSVRDLRSFFSQTDRRQLGQVVLVTLGPTELKMVGFVTRQDLSDLPTGMPAGEVLAVYLPFSYALGGATVLVPRTAVQPLDMPLEAAMRFALTAGVKGEEPTAKA